MAVLSALAGSSVHTFSIARNDALLSVGAWALCLPQLESLSVEANHVTVSVDLSPLKRLTRLSLLSRWEIPKFPLPTGMPPRLRELELQHFNAGAFSECATTAGALQHLQGLTLSRPSMDRSSVPWDWLLLRTALTSLTLSDWNGISTLPSQLAALTGLQQLGFQFCFLPDTDMAMHPLRALTALTSLDVTANGWECIPASVFALPSLQELDARENGDSAFYDPYRHLAGSSSLTKLSLSAPLALGAAMELVRFPALHTLCLESDTDLFRGFRENEQHEVVGRLLGELKRLPRFAVLDVHEVWHPAFLNFFRSQQVLNIEYPYQIVGLESVL